MLQRVQPLGVPTLGAGLATYPNFFALQPGQTPNCLDVRFLVGDAVEKRLGATTLNATVLTSTSASDFAVDAGRTLGIRLQAVWRLDEQSGVRYDATGNGNTLTEIGQVNSVVGFSTGVIGNAAVFNTSSRNSLNGGNPAALQTGDIDYAVHAWVSLASVTNNTALLSKDVEHYLYYDSANAAFRFEVWGSGSVVAGSALATTFGAAAANTWYAVYAFHSTNNTVGISINGGTAAAINSAPTTTAAGSSATQFRLGSREDGGTDGGGAMDHVVFWKKALNDVEISNMYNVGVGNAFGGVASQSGWGSFDFGAGFAGGVPLRWLIVAAGTGIFASSNRGMTFVTIATDRGAHYQRFDRAGPYLLAVSETMNRVLYWSGSVGTSMLGMPVGSAPPAKHVIGDFQGFTFLMNHSGGLRQIAYGDATTVPTNAWASTFSLPSSLDDEITGGMLLNKKLYAFSRYKVFRISHVGGNPDFAYQEVKGWGAVPGTIQKVTFPDIGEVIVCLGWDRKIRVFDGAEDRVISDMVEQDNGLSPVSLARVPIEYLHKCHAVFDPLEQVYKLYLVITPSTETVYTLNLNVRTGAWYPYSNQTYQTATLADSGNSRILVGVKRDGFVYHMDTTNRDLTTAIPEYYQSPFYVGKTPEVATKQQKVYLHFSPTSSGTLYYEDRPDWRAAFTTRSRFALADTTTVTQVREEVDVPSTTNVYQFQLSSSASTANPWRLTRADVLGTALGVGAA